MLVREIICFQAFAACVNRMIVVWVITASRVVILFDVSEERAASIFMVTELGSGGRWSAWEEEVCRLYGKVVRMWPIRATKREAGIDIYLSTVQEFSYPSGGGSTLHRNVGLDILSGIIHKTNLKQYLFVVRNIWN
jgi:hypothetical protein